MEEKNVSHVEPEAPRRSRGPAVLAAIALIFGVGAFGYGIKQSQQASEVNQQSMQLTSAMKDMQHQISALTAKVIELSTPPPQPAPVKASGPAASKSASAAKRAEDKRFKDIQAKLADHDKALASTHEEMERTRTDLDGRLTAARDELGGSIARTDSELASLKKRGERDITEFDVTKSKELQRAGPISIALRKTDTKHKRYNLDLLVEDSRLEKKNVNLYEPIWIHRADDPQPVQLVVYEIGKNRVRGYVNAPKFRQSQLAPAAPAAAETTPQLADPPQVN